MFDIIKKSSEASQARAGVIHTPHGDILTPAFIPVGTKATVKSLSVEVLQNIQSEALLANTYHLHLQPGEDIVQKHGGFAKMMNWKGPSFTDSGGFQVFSLGAAFDTGVSKIATSSELSKKQEQSIDDTGNAKIRTAANQMAKIDEEGVTFKSYIDGSSHRFTPESSMQIQNKLGPDIFFAFDECTSPLATKEYQISAMNRTHRWAIRCLAEHKRLGVSKATNQQQALFAVVQGGAYTDLREESAKTLGNMSVDGIQFDGFGIGGSFTKEDMDKTVKSATLNLPENKPRHLLGIGEPIDFFIGIEYGIDTFDCVTPTRVARHGNIYTESGRINILNSKYKDDMSNASDDINSPIHNYTKAYLAHLFRAKEMLGAELASAHNLYFLIKLVRDIRQSILDDRFYEFKNEFCTKYYGEKYVIKASILK
jgi:queuine tRNA-ribosyltransferase